MNQPQLPSYHHTLLRYVAVFICIPVLVLFSFIYINLFNENLENAQTKITQHGGAITSEIRAKLSELRNQVYKVAGNRAVSEVPINILYSQNAQYTLEQLVETNTLVSSAFIQDDEGFVIEGWPIAALGMRSGALKTNTKAAMLSSRERAEAQLFWMLPEQYTTGPVTNNSPQKTQHNSHLLIYALPLFAETDSIITPYIATGTLNVVLDLEQLSRHQSHTEETDKHNLELVANGFVLFEKAALGLEDIMAQSFDTQLLVQHSTGQVPLEMTLQYDREKLTSDFWWQTSVQVAPLLLFIPIMVWGLYRFTRNFNQPVNQMVEMCRQLVSGNYNVAPQSANYREFDLLFRRLDTMAQTISEQIKSLESARSRAEQSERIKTQFLANMSHEIRTPMNGVLGMLQLMEAGQLTDEQKERLNIAKTSAQNLLQIINDILDISKIEANKITIEHIPCNVAQLVQVQTDNMQAQAEKQKNVLRALIKPPFHCDWLTDPTRLSQILTNLLSNALKFTKGGKVMVVLAQPEDNCFEITVKDTGIGIAQDKLATLFQPFQQADSSTTREYGGTGLGLSISKNLCELMGGDLKVFSEPGKGSTFVVTIAAEPIQGDSEHQDIQVSEAHETIVTSDNQLNKSKKVAVIAEDNEINQEVLKAMLQGFDLELHLASNGRDAVALVEFLNPDIVLMDVHMPHMDGVTATKTIRERGHTMPIIMQTANVMTEDVKHYLAMGANDIVAKPIVQKQLADALNKWL
ncbi:ATP-binding protein [Planctobacterium marinum]|uniref:Sensory/regulatory protein RpfC n=1 Tax=Planctobacterium marinum TaxID=1631968 RepID=A0AA48KQ45_9ALTE|nr:hypothetical protein MACH26_28870 [Planctobacterium marinum]